MEYAYYFISSDNVLFQLNIPLCLLVPHLWEVNLKHTFKKKINSESNTLRLHISYIIVYCIMEQLLYLN